MREMQKICKQLELRKGVYIKFHVYGYSSHLEVYKDIKKIVLMTDNDQRQIYINNLNSCKLRDIKSKLGSEGRVQCKQKMKKGFIDMLPKLQAAMAKNGNTTNNMMNTDNDDINSIENRMESDRVQEANNGNSVNCDANDDSTMSNKQQLDEETTEAILIEPPSKKRKLNRNV